MRRWQAIPVAAVVALLAATLLYGGTQPQTAYAGSPTLTISLDCDPGTPGVQSACVFLSGTTNVDIDVIVTNTGTASSIGSVQFTAVGSPSVTFSPDDRSANPGTNDDNPDADPVLANLQCTSPDPDNDTGADGDPNTTESLLSCFTGAANGPALSGALRIATIHYTATGDGVGSFILASVAVTDNGLSEIGSCNPEIDAPATCVGATIQIGASSDTPTPIPAATNTPLPAATCVQGVCPTFTSVGFKSVTPTPSATVPVTPGAAGTPVPGAPTAPGGTTGGGGAPGGGAGGEILPPDTGQGAGNGSGTTTTLGLIGALAVAATLSGGLWFAAAAARAHRREGGD